MPRIIALVGGVVILLTAFFVFQGYAQESVTFSTYYPIPHASYYDLDTEDFTVSQQTVNNEFIKIGDGNIVIFRAASTPFSYRDLHDENYFTRSEFNNIRRFIQASPTTVLSAILNVLRAVDLKDDGGALTTNRIQSMLSFKVQENLTAFEQEYNFWPGLGNCRLPGILQGCPGGICPFIGIIATRCNPHEYLATFNELPGGFVLVMDLLGGDHSDDGNDFALGLGGGLKVGTFSYACCELFQERNIQPIQISLPCQGVLNRFQDPTLLASLQTGTAPAGLVGLFRALALAGDDGDFFPCYSDIAADADDLNCGGNGWEVSLDAKHPTGDPWPLPAWEEGTDGVNESYCFTALPLLQRKCRRAAANYIENLDGIEGVSGRDALLLLEAFGIQKSDTCQCITDLSESFFGDDQQRNVLLNSLGC
ncbi:MAG: hypothetical protein KBA46_04685 [Candidatus Omnitrophica bacterium]|nr:hypothetical protein [Candidatus Omnitrophota bacterium]